MLSTAVLDAAVSEHDAERLDTRGDGGLVVLPAVAVDTDRPAHREGVIGLHDSH